MLNSYLFKQNLYKIYAKEFNQYAINIIYGSNILIGADIEDKWKNRPTDDDT